jgi:hypothetical protein
MDFLLAGNGPSPFLEDPVCPLMSSAPYSVFRHPDQCFSNRQKVIGFRKNA